MKSSHWVLAIAMIVSALILRKGEMASHSQEPPPKKPSPKVIDASKYSTLQKAVDALPATGGIVQLPPGQFPITSPIVVTSEDVAIVGSGTSTWLINNNTDGEPALILRPKNRESNKGARIWRAQVSDLRISGNKKSGDGLLAEGVNEIYLRGISVERNGGHGIHLIDCYEDPRVIGCLMTYNGNAGLHIKAGHDIVVSANQFEENLDGLQCIDSFNLCMTGNNLDDHLRHGVVIENTYGSVLSGNMIEECKDTAVVIDRDCYGITISSNVIAHNFGGGVDLRDGWGCAISANTFTIVAKRSVAIGPGSGRITISGNSFSNSHIGGEVKREDAAAGIELNGTRDILISGNGFTGIAEHAVKADDKTTNLSIVGNLISEVGLKAKAPVPGLKVPQKRQTIIQNNLEHP